MLPKDDDAKRLKDQTLLLEEFLVQHAPRFAAPAITRKAIVHGHCHAKSVLGFDKQKKLFDEVGLDYTILDSGCCGMAGAFGYEKGEHYSVSIASGERVLLPAVRGAADDTLIVADGFSCREQIQQTTSRHAVHLAELLAMGLERRRHE